MHRQSARGAGVDSTLPPLPPPLVSRELTLLQMGQGDGSFLYLVPSSPLASNSSLFICLGPKERRRVFSLGHAHLPCPVLPCPPPPEELTHPRRASCGAPA